MRARRPLVASFEELMERYYGRAEPRLLRGTAAMDELFATYYGQLPESAKARSGVLSVRLSLECDDGKKVLAQRNRFLDRPRSKPAPEKAAAPDGSHTRIGPLELSADDGAALVAPPATPAPTQLKVEVLPPAPPPRHVEEGSARSAAASVVRPAASDGSAIKVSENDFLADMQSIFAGESVYDPVRQKTIPKSVLKEHPREPEPAEESPRRDARASDGQAIFDRIAKSMQYAGAYDLGDVELENRFADFDRMDEAKQKVAEAQQKRKTAAKASPVTDEAKVDNADFIQDLDAIQKQAAGMAAAAPPSVAEQASVPRGYSAPLYVEGEHALAGGDLYRDQLLVGNAPGVLFSYGQIIAMADLFGSVEEMMAADSTVLQRLKALIEQSTTYFKNRKAPPLEDVPTKTWQKATDRRYLKLAEDNYDHFAPNLLFKDERFARFATKYGNHKLAWEQHHERAIKEAQRMALDPAFGKSSYIPSWPLIINAFGDHFLTDAFAAGHVINKEVVVEYFKSMFYSGSSLTPDGNRFFDKVAAKAWHGDVAQKLSQLETAEPYDAWWNIVNWNPDINSADRFATVLKGAATQAPDKVANLAVKAVHDVLNREGVEVVNGAGSPPWKLTGDGHLTPATLTIMMQAVKQSADNITDPSILASNISFPSYFAKVWAYVPQLPPASQAKVKTLVTSYVNPTSTQLVEASARIIEREIDSLIEALLEKKALQPA
jgi:hypothetical protein